MERKFGRDAAGAGRGDDAALGLRGRALPRPPGEDLPRPLRPAHVPVPVAGDGLLRRRSPSERARRRAPATCWSPSTRDWRFGTEHSVIIREQLRRARRRRAPPRGRLPVGPRLVPDGRAGVPRARARIRVSGRGQRALRGRDRALRDPPRRTLSPLLGPLAPHLPGGHARCGCSSWRRSTATGNTTRPRPSTGLADRLRVTPGPAHRPRVLVGWGVGGVVADALAARMARPPAPHVPARLRRALRVPQALRRRPAALVRDARVRPPGPRAPHPHRLARHDARASRPSWGSARSTSSAGLLPARPRPPVQRAPDRLAPALGRAR